MRVNVWFRAFAAALAVATLVPRASPAQSPADAQYAAAASQREKTFNAMSASLEQQKTSVRRQRNSPRDNATNPGTPPPVPDFFVTDALLENAASAADCEPLSQLEVQSLTQRAAQANAVSADLIRAVMRQESAFRPCVVSSAGAVGLMQLMPETAADLGVADSLNPEENAFGGAKFLRQLLDRYNGDLNRTLGAYNAGPSNVDLYRGVPNFSETITYVNRIMRDLGTSVGR